MNSNAGHTPKRILCVTSSFPRWEGDSTTPFVLNLAVDLLELGWEIDVLAPHAAGTARREVVDGIGVRRFQYLCPEAMETICYQGGALINLRRDKTNYLKLPFFVGSQWFHIMKSLIRRKYNILHSHWILPQGFNGVLTAGVLNIPHVLTVHGGDIFGLQNRLLGKLKSKVLYHADAVTVNSSVTEKAVVKVAPEVKNLHRIPMGVSTDLRVETSLFMELRENYRKGNGPLLVFAGRLVDEKGVEDVIRAVGMLVGRFDGVSVLIVGEGQDRAELERLSRSSGLSQRVFFAGWVAPELIRTYLAAGDIFIGPSRQAPDGWIEAQGLTFLEAMIAKTPVVATRVGGIVDCVKHEITGLLVKERSPEEIADAVCRLVEEPGLKNRLIANGYALAASGFSRATCARAFSDLFASLIGCSKRGV
jgi:phosphatidyl-myo-inositol dimannoside synthase